MYIWSAYDERWLSATHIIITQLVKIGLLHGLVVKAWSVRDTAPCHRFKLNWSVPWATVFKHGLFGSVTHMTDTLVC